MDLPLIKKHIKAHQEDYIQDLITLLRIPSISAQKNHISAMNACAEQIASFLQQAGFDNARLLRTSGHPCVFAERIEDKNLPTVLVYGHYDVQPPDPLHLWTSPPFEPTIRDGKIFARGSADDKGQFMMHIKAIELLLSEYKKLPCNVKILIEGEEEIGSPSLPLLVQEHQDVLACDIVLISDSAMRSLAQPTIDVGMRGLAYLEIKVTSAMRDLHSGVYGGAVPNPITLLCQMIASLHDKNNKIAIPHFYDDVAELSVSERQKLARLPHDKKVFLAETGCLDIWGEQGFDIHECIGFRPTLELNGIWGGYTGEGAKTVLPAEAYAKISCRLVPHQKHETIAALVKKHLEKIAPPTVKIEVLVLHGGDPYVIETEHIGYQAAERAIETTFGTKPIPVRGGGSIPIVAIFEKLLHAKTVFLGFGLDDDCLHSPNEKFAIGNYLKGIETIPFFYHYFAALHASQKK